MLDIQKLGYGKSRIYFSWSYLVRGTQDCEGSEILPYWRADTLACHSFTDAGRRHDNSEWQGILLLMSLHTAWASCSYWSPLPPKSRGAIWSSPEEPLQCSGAESQLRKPQSVKGNWKPTWSTLAWKGDIIFITTVMKQIYPLPKRETQSL